LTFDFANSRGAEMAATFDGFGREETRAWTSGPDTISGFINVYNDRHEPTHETWSHYAEECEALVGSLQSPLQRSCAPQSWRRYGVHLTARDMMDERERGEITNPKSQIIKQALPATEPPRTQRTQRGAKTGLFSSRISFRGTQMDIP
jgi:hypothetical protein